MAAPGKQCDKRNTTVDNITTATTPPTTTTKIAKTVTPPQLQKQRTFTAAERSRFSSVITTAAARIYTRAWPFDKPKNSQ